VSEPAADHVHLDAGLEEMDGRRMPDHVRADALGGDGRDALRRSRRVPFHQVVDAKSA